MTSVLVVGVAVVDYVFVVDEIPTQPEKYVARDAMVVGGGCAGNAAVAISRLGGSAHLASRFGTDAIADTILSGLHDEGVETSLCDRRGVRSACSTILVDAQGERQIVNFRGEGLTSDPTHLGNAPTVDAVLADTRWPQGATFAMNLARERGVPGVMDVEADTDPGCLSAASHLAFSAQGLSALYPGQSVEEGLASAARDHRAWCCATLGPDGVAYIDDGKLHHVPAYAVAVKDTTGAGDIWHGAFTLGLAEGMAELESIRFANAAAALKCARLGGRSGAPTRPEVEEVLTKGGA